MPHHRLQSCGLGDSARTISLNQTDEECCLLPCKLRNKKVVIRAYYMTSNEMLPRHT